jgi:hypothetical protein
MLIAPVQDSKMLDATLLQESIVVGDFCQSYIVASPPSTYEPGMVLNYQLPEAWFKDSKVGLPDVRTERKERGCKLKSFESLSKSLRPLHQKMVLVKKTCVAGQQQKWRQRKS